MLCLRPLRHFLRNLLNILVGALILILFLVFLILISEVWILELNILQQKDIKMNKFCKNLRDSLREEFKIEVEVFISKK